MQVHYAQAQAQAQAQVKPPEPLSHAVSIQRPIGALPASTPAPGPSETRKVTGNWILEKPEKALPPAGRIFEENYVWRVACGVCMDVWRVACGL